jgi:prepilin-type N-terminal cleavage/methylation domain-containing protein
MRLVSKKRSLSFLEKVFPGASKGFTLTEVMVAIIIIGLVTALTIPAFSRFNSRQVLVQEAKDLETNLRLVQSQSVSSLEGLLWGVRLVSGAAAYEVFGTRSAYNFRVSSKSKSLSSGVTISSVAPNDGAAANAVFGRLSGEASFVDDNGGSLGGGTAMTITLSYQGQTAEVVITPEGRIYEN